MNDLTGRAAQGPRLRVSSLDVGAGGALEIPYGVAQFGARVPRGGLGEGVEDLADPVHMGRDRPVVGGGHRYQDVLSGLRGEQVARAGADPPRGVAGAGMCCNG